MIPNVAPNRTISFGRHVFAPASGQLWRGAREIRLTPKAAAVLAALVARPGAILTKDDLFAAVWPGVAVSDAALTSCIQELRGALGDDARRPRYIETIHRRGYRFIASVSPAAPGAPAAPAHVVGRERALEVLGACLARARRGERQLVLVSGEPGIGKTTVVERFLAGVADDGVGIGTGRCIEHYGAGEAYLPLLEALTRLGLAPGSVLVPILRRHAPTWLAQLPSLVAPAELRTLQRTTAGTTRERMLRELAEAVETLAAETPIVLWLEDLHWSDASTLDWLAYIARRPGAARLLVVATYRPADAIPGRHPLPAVRDELLLHGQCRDLALDLLDEPAVRRYLEARFQPCDDPAALGRLAALIHRRTEGNPLFMVGVVEDLVARGVLATRGARWCVATPPEAAELAIPEDVRGLIALQFGRLAEGERRLLEAASVAGVEFSAATVAAGLGADRAEAEAGCAALARRGSFLVARGTDSWPDGTVAERYAFGHWLHQQVVYDHVTGGRRAALHRRIAERLTAAYGERADEIAVELAAHFEHGGDARRAVPCLQRAAAVAARRGAPRAAQEHLTRALRLLATLPASEERVRQEVALQVPLGTSLMATGGWGTPEAELPYARAEELCKQLGDTPQLFPVVWGIWLFRWGRSELATAEALGERLRMQAERAGDPALVLQAHHALWATHLVRGAPVKALEHARHGIALYEPDAHAALATVYGHHDAGVCARVMLAWTLDVLDEPEEADRVGAASLELAGRLGHPFTETLAYVFAAHRARFRGDAERASAFAQRAMALSREQGLALMLAWATVMHGWALAETGRAAEGVAATRDAIARARASGSHQLQTFLLGTLAETLHRAGEAAAAAVVVDEALTLAARTGERFYEAELHRLDGELRLTAGPALVGAPARTATECFEAALAVARHQGARAFERRVIASRAAHDAKGVAPLIGPVDTLRA